MYVNVWVYTIKNYLNSSARFRVHTTCIRYRIVVVMYCLFLLLYRLNVVIVKMDMNDYTVSITTNVRSTLSTLASCANNRSATTRSLSVIYMSNSQHVNFSGIPFYYHKCYIYHTMAQRL